MPTQVSPPRSLPDYVRYVLKLKELTHEAVQARSGGRITHSYISKIVSGTAKNLTVDKIVALARGLGVDEYELFNRAIGRMPRKDKDVRQLQAEIYLSHLPDERQDDALAYLQSLFKRYGKPSAEVLSVVQKLKRKAS